MLYVTMHSGSVGLMSSGCVVQSPQCILMSSTNVIFMHRSALVVCNHFTINSEIYYTSPMERFWKPDSKLENLIKNPPNNNLSTCKGHKVPKNYSSLYSEVPIIYW